MHVKQHANLRQEHFILVHLLDRCHQSSQIPRRPHSNPTSREKTKPCSSLNWPRILAWRHITFVFFLKELEPAMRRRSLVDRQSSMAQNRFRPWHLRMLRSLLHTQLGTLHMRLVLHCQGWTWRQIALQGQSFGTSCCSWIAALLTNVSLISRMKYHRARET